MEIRSKLVLAIVFTTFLLPIHALAQSLTLTSPTVTQEVAEGDDFATTELNDPWDMTERRDVGWEQNFDGDSISVANGIWKGSNAISDGYIFPLFGGFKNLLHAEGLPGDRSMPKLGINHPVNSAKYTLLSYRSKVSSPSSYAVMWNNNTTTSYWPEGENVAGSYDGFFHASKAFRYDSWKVYSFDMSNLGASFAMPQGSWSGNIYSLRLDLSVGGAAGVTSEFDWVRLVDPDSAPTINITWNSSSLSSDALVTIYLDTDASGFNGTPIAEFSNSGASSGSYALKSAMLPPGNYYFYVTSRRGNSLTQEARSGYSARLRVNAKPTGIFTSPTSITGEDYATSTLGDPWDMSNAEDVANISPGFYYPLQNMSSWSFVNGIFQAVADPPITELGHTMSDAQVHMRVSSMTPIDTRKYRYVTYRVQLDPFWYSTIEDKVRNGWVGRSVMWNSDIMTDGVLPPDHVLWEGWNTYTYDMKGDNAGQGLQGMGVPFESLPTIYNYRMDPAETTLPHWFYLDWVKFSADNRAEDGYFDVGFDINDNDDSSFTVSLYYDNNNQGFNGTKIATLNDLSAGAHSYRWNTSELSNGQEYYIYLEISDGQNTSRVYSPVHVAIGALSAAPARTSHDYDGDGVSDQVIFRPHAGAFFVNQSSAGPMMYNWGTVGDLPIEGDFDGDGKADIGIVRQHGVYLLWYIRLSSTGELFYRSWGLIGDELLASDFNGDGRDEIAVYRQGVWYIQYADYSVETRLWGVVGDQPKRCDFDGDGKTDFGIWRPSDGYWWVINSGYNSGRTDDPFTVGQYGTSNDQAHCTDSDNDGRADMIMRWFKQSKWWFKDGIADGVHEGIQWGLPRDVTLLGGDFNNDGDPDITVVRPESFVWYHKHEGDDFSMVQWGLPGDLVPK